MEACLFAGSAASVLEETACLLACLPACLVCGLTAPASTLSQGGGPQAPEARPCLEGGAQLGKGRGTAGHAGRERSRAARGSFRLVALRGPTLAAGAWHGRLIGMQMHAPRLCACRADSWACHVQKACSHHVGRGSGPPRLLLHQLQLPGGGHKQRHMRRHLQATQGVDAVSLGGSLP